MILRSIITFGLFYCSTAQEWSAPYFEPSPNSDVSFEYNQDTAIIRMDEELSTPIVLAIINNYDGNIQPVANNFMEGQPLNLNLTIERNSGVWELIANNRQDYEQGHQLYYFEIIISGISNKGAVILHINNIFDNAPTIMAEVNPCQDAPELNADYLTSCKFIVRDLDGFVNNDISFVIDGQFNEETLFRMEKAKDDVETIYERQYFLYIIGELDFFEKSLYSFKIKVYDTEQNEGSTDIIVQVIDLPNKDPIWTRPFTSENILEKSVNRFTVQAIDGDTGINEPICYRLNFDENTLDYADFLQITTDNGFGIIDVGEIDRDMRKNEVYRFKIFAYKCQILPEWGIQGDAVIIVSDINDNIPMIHFSKDSPIKIKEAQFSTLFTSSELYIEDLDLDIHATYDVTLTQEDGVEFSNAFSIVPNQGYQRQGFSINVIDTTLIDYEDPPWQRFTVTIIAKEMESVELWEDKKSFEVELLDWNDELPIFDNPEVYVKVEETVPEDTLIGTVRATDRDVDDTIIYSLVGSISELISINEFGELRTKFNNTFDYQRQTRVIFQIQAEDTMQKMNETTHKVFAQFTVDVIDVNNVTPELRIPRDVLKIKENVRDGPDAIITENIFALDPDSNANLVLKIDWSSSTASKPGFLDEKEFYENILILDQKEDPNNNRVRGTLSVNSSFEYNLDYERFEIIYLTIVVTDLNQLVGESQAMTTLTIFIEDENDNAPEFIGNTLTIARNVVEQASLDSVIGTILARDIDGPEFNVINYSLEPISNTPPDLVKIDPVTGLISVAEGDSIDCDEPPRLTLEYTILLNDGAHTTRGDIKINIIDINNKFPQVGVFAESIKMFENATTGDFITQIWASDADRDEPHNTIQYTINFLEFPELQKYFMVDDLTGDLKVQLEGNNFLDRDDGAAMHEIRIRMEDNYLGNGGRNGNVTMVQLILLDVNDNHPEMPVKSAYTVSENAGLVVIDGEFYAPDKDEPNTPNSWVLYEIVSIFPDFENAPTGFENLFHIENYGNLYGRILINDDIKGFYGSWNVEIRAYDLGDTGPSQISLSSQATYTVVIEAFNFNAPEIIFPRESGLIRLAFDQARVGVTLTTISSGPLAPFEARDEDGEIFGDVTFDVSSDGNVDSDFFEMRKLNRNQSELILKKVAEERFYNLTITATDGNKGPNYRSSVVNKIGINFATGDPFFLELASTTDFTENDLGLKETRYIPEAKDRKNDGVNNEEDKFPIYYFIDPTYRPADAIFFKLDKISRALSLVNILDRETVDNHQIKIVASNTETFPDRGVSVNQELILDISVNDVNDNPPTFNPVHYGVGISVNDNQNKVLFTLFATDPDLDDIITYSLIDSSVKAEGTDIFDMRDTAFRVGATGEVRLNFVVRESMAGFFEFNVLAKDLVDHTHTATVKIFIVAESNRVTFVFINPVSQFAANPLLQSILSDIFSAAYKNLCNIDDINEGSTEGTTNVRAHFISNNNEAIEATVIQESSSNALFITNLKTALQSHSLYLQDVPVTLLPSDGNDHQIVQLFLIILSSLLGLLCAILIVLFFIRTKSLNRQIKALGESSFESHTSDLNRKVLPNTNVFSVEKSNPVQNSKMPKIEFDNTSLSSESDDFADIHDNPLFKPKKENTYE